MDKTQSMEQARKDAERAHKHAEALRAEGDHRGAQEYDDAAAASQFYAIHGFTPEAFDAANQED